MSRLDDFAVMILCHGRAENVPTYVTLRKNDYSGRIIIVCDDEDKDLSNYQKIYPEVEVFSKKEVLKCHLNLVMPISQNSMVVISLLHNTKQALKLTIKALKERLIQLLLSLRVLLNHNMFHST